MSKLVVIIPALNEDKTIGSVIGAIPSMIAGISSIETIVIDDGSTDSTRQVSEQAGPAWCGTTPRSASAQRLERA